MTARTQSSLAVSLDGEDWVLLNASPDLRAQILATPALHPRRDSRRGKRDTPIGAVLLTNGDLDHIAGLLTLREQQPFRLVATHEILRVLDANPVFGALDRSLVSVSAVELGQTLEIAPGVSATLFPAPGKTPLFLEGDGPIVTDLEGEQTVGVELTGAAGRIVYIPGCARMTPSLEARLKDAPLVLFDGTVYHDDEMIRAGVGAKTGARMGHMAMAGAEGSMAAFRDLGVRRKIYLHVNNTNPALREGSPERAEVERAGWEVAFDGMEVSPEEGAP